MLAYLFWIFSTILLIFHVTNEKIFHHICNFNVRSGKKTPYSFIRVSSFIREFRICAYFAHLGPFSFCFRPFLDANYKRLDSANLTDMLDKAVVRPGE